MTITTTRSNRDELETRLASLLGELGMTIDALDARRAAGSLTADEWAVWEQVDAIRYLLDR